jgi:hypothetical protein
MRKNFIILFTAVMLCSCATPAEQMTEMMEEADEQIATASRSGGVTTLTCLRVDGIIDLSGNPFVTASAKVLLVKKSAGDGAPEC